MFFNPFYEFEKMRDIMDQFLREFSEGSRKHEYDYVNIYEGENGYILQFITPGVDLKDIDINISNGILHVKVERKPETEKKEDLKLIRQERGDINFTRSFKISDDTDIEKIEAKVMNGLLMIYVPKKEELKPKKISVKVQ